VVAGSSDTPYGQVRPALAFVGGDDSPSGDKETADAPVVDGVFLPDLDHHTVFRRTDPVCPWSAHSLRLADCGDLIAQHPTRRRSHRCLSHSQRRESDPAMAARGTAVRRGSLPPIHEPLAPGQRGGPHDTITGHVSLRPVSTVLLRIAVLAFQAACRGFEPRLPLQSLLVHSTSRALIRGIPTGPSGACSVTDRLWWRGQEPPNVPLVPRVASMRDPAHGRRAAPSHWRDRHAT